MKKIYLLAIAVLLISSAKAQITTSEVIVKQTNGNVGIGTGAPAFPLHIFGNDNQPLRIERNTASGVWLDMKNSEGTWSIGTDENSFRFYDRVKGQYKMTLNANGNLGIGIIEAEHLLHLYGDENQPLKIERNNAKGVWLDVKNSEGTWSIGTDDNSLRIYDRSKGQYKLAIDSLGRVGIGTTAPKYTLDVVGSIHASGEVTWPDYVFQESYVLPSLTEVEDNLKLKGHLANIPSAEEVNKNGVNMVEMDAKLLQKIEELTLYIIEQDKRIKALEAKVKD